MGVPKALRTGEATTLHADRNEDDWRFWYLLTDDLPVGVALREDEGGRLPGKSSRSQRSVR